MITLSNEQKAALHDFTRFDHVRGTVGGAAFDDSNIISMNYSNRASDTSDITFGLAYVGQISVEFVGVNIPRKNWRAGTKIKLQWGFDYIDENEDPATFWTDAGEFYIASAEWTETGVAIIANDVISKFDKAFGNIQTNSNSLYGYALFACEQCGVTFALSEIQTRNLPNGNAVLTLHDKNDIKTWRDFIGHLAGVAGGFATATRDGKLTIKSFANSSVVDMWATSDRIAGGSFSDYDTAYDGISYTLINQNVNVDLLGHNPHGSGAFIQCGANPFLQNGSAAAEALATIATSINWAPFQTALLSNMVYDLGDLITCSHGIAGPDPLTCCIMSIEWTFKQLTNYKGYGADPSLTNGKTKTDKAINALQNQVQGGKIDFVKFINSSAFTIEDEETEIAEIRFAVAYTADVEEWSEIKLKATNPAELILRYYLDDELIAEYTPSESWNEGGYDIYIEGTALCFKKRNTAAANDHTINFHWHISDVEPSTFHRWKITAQATTGTVTIASGDEHVILWAQGMAGEDNWGGMLEAADEVPFLPFGVLDLFGELSDNVSLTIVNPSEPKNIITENGDYLSTENGDHFVTI